MKKWYAVGIGLIGLLLVAGGPSPGWAQCAISVTGDSRGDIITFQVGGNGVVQYSFKDVDGLGGGAAAACTDNCFDTDGGGPVLASTTDGHSGLLFSPSASGELSQNLDAAAAATGNNWPGIAATGSTTFQPVPGSPAFASGAGISCVAVSNERNFGGTPGTTGGPDTEIWLMGRGGTGDIFECIFDLDGDQDLIEPRFDSAAGVGDLDDDGWIGLSSASPCFSVP